MEDKIKKSSKKAPLVEDVLKELDGEIMAKKESHQIIKPQIKEKPIEEKKPIMEISIKEKEEKPLAKEQIEKIETKVEESIKHRLPTVSELVQQTKKRFALPKTRQRLAKKEYMIRTLKETFEWARALPGNLNVKKFGSTRWMLFEKRLLMPSATVITPAPQMSKFGFLTTLWKSGIRVRFRQV